MEEIVKTYMPIAPEIFLLLMTGLVLLASVFFEKARHHTLYLSLLTLLGTAVITIYAYYTAGLSPDNLLFYGQFVFDKLAFVLKLFIYLMVAIIFIYSRYYNEDHHLPNNEFYSLGLLSTFGMMILVSAHNFIILFLGMELMSLPIYAMVALQRGKERCVEAAMKYFVIGALASGMLLYGMSLLFGVTQSLDISMVAQFVALHFSPQNLLLLFGLVFVMAGVAFKLGAAPFHMWVPDVYDGSPTSATLFLSTAPKLAAFGLALRLVIEAMPTLVVQWSEILIVIAVLSIAIGNLAAIMQSNIKRLLAYSSIAHMGYMTLGLVTGVPRGYAAALFYMITYVFMTSGAFGLIALMSKFGIEANEIRDFAGLNDRNPWLAFLMMIIMFSLAGVPPLVGFIAKVGIIEVLIQAHLVWLAVLAIIFAIIGAYYYIHVVKVMYFESTPHAQPIQYQTDIKIVISLNCLAILISGIFPGPLFALCHWVF